MPVNYIVLAIPVFFVLIGIEILVARIKEREYYRLSDSINDLSCGVIQQLLEVFLKTALFAGYIFLYENHRVFQIPGTSVAAWLVCFVGVDFFYYWFHRMSHEVNGFWAAHVVHHQSEDFNLAVALRQGALQQAFSWIFYLPLAVVGFPPLMFLTLSSFNTLYQFWIHTRTIGKLGPFELVFSTPSNHRVHHGCNPKYIDKNYGGTLIVWDRLFGSFREEEEEPVYGITKPLGSWNPVWANVHYWMELAQKAKRASRFSDKVRMFLKPPGWQPEELGGFTPAPEIDPATYRKFDTPVPRGLGLYLLTQFLAVLVFSAVLLHLQEELSRSLLVLGSLAIAWTLVTLGGLLDGKSWAFRLEAIRIASMALVATLSAILPGGPLPRNAGQGYAVFVIASALTLGAALLLWLFRFRALPGTMEQT